MFSEMPSTPGRRQQIPRTLRSTWHAGLRRAVQRADAAPVDERVHLHPRSARARRARARRSSRSISSSSPSRMPLRRDEQLAVAQRPRHAGEEVEHVGDVGADLLVAGEQAEVRVQARGLRVVVAGADVDVVAHAVALAAHDEDALGVRLQARVAVDDVHAGLLERARPGDVRALVEARLELDHADRLLAALGRADERRQRAASRRTCGTRSA